MKLLHLESVPILTRIVSAVIPLKRESLLPVVEICSGERDIQVVIFRKQAIGEQEPKEVPAQNQD